MEIGYKVTLLLELFVLELQSFGFLFVFVLVGLWLSNESRVDRSGKVTLAMVGSWMGDLLIY